MTKQIINIGQTPNDKSGDPLRVAFDKVNQNFTELYGRIVDSVAIGSTPPASPTAGGLWYNNNDGRLYVYYNSAWVDTSSNAGTNALIYTGATPPTSPVANELWFNTEDGKIYIRYSDTWIDTSVPAAGAGGTGDITFVAEEMYRLGGLSISNKDGSHNPTAFINIPANGDNDIELRSLYGGVTIGTGPNNAITSVWNFDDAGILRLPNDAYIEPVSQSINIGVQGRLQILTDAASNLTTKAFLFDSDGTLVLPSTVGDIKRDGVSVLGGGSFSGVLNGVEDDATPAIDFFSGAQNNHKFTLASDWTLKLKARALGANQGHLWLEAGQNTKIKVNGNGSTVNIVASNGTDTATWTFSKDGSTVFGNGLKFLGNGNELTVDNTATSTIDLRNTSGTGFYTDNDGLVLRGNGSYSWRFGTDGHLTLPHNSDFAHIQANSNKSINIQTTGTTVNRVQVTPIDGVKIYTNNDANGWRFDNSGKLTMPNGIEITNDGAIQWTDSQLTIKSSSTSDDTAGAIFFDPLSSFEPVSISVRTNTNGGYQLWSFGSRFPNSGYIRWPDGTQQTTAWTGNTDEKIKIGELAGSSNQGSYAISIGKYAGLGDQGTNAIAIGYGAGGNQQAINGIAIGSGAGNINQGQGAIAIGGGGSGGNDQGYMSIAIGYNAGYTSQPAHTIILNASGTIFDAVASQTNSFYVNPIRNDNTASKTLLYNTTTKEVTYGDRGAINVDGNIVLTAGTAVFTFGTDGGVSFPGTLDVEGATTFNGDITFNGNVTLPGTITQVSGNSGEFFGDPVTGDGALYAGKTGYTPVPDTVFQTTGYVNGYIQNNFENTHPGNQASAEWVVTADNGTDTTGYIDYGMAGSGWDGTQSNSLGTAVLANDGWVYVQNGTGTAGGNLILGATTSGKKVKIVAGGTGSGAVVADFSSTGLNVVGSVTAASFTGALTGNVTGNVSGSAGSVTWTNVSSKPTFATVATSGSYTDLSDKPTLATVATSGSYTDLTNKPTIPPAYTLPIADTSTLGGVKVDGTTITINGSGVISAVTGAAAAGTLTGTTLASGVTASSLTSVGTLTSLQVSGALVRNGNMSQAAWGSNGVGLRLMNATYTDTSSSGTLATSNVHYIGQPTLAFSSATTVTQANTVYISGAPVAGTNATLSVPYALNVASGAVNFGGVVRFNGALQSGGGASIITLSNSAATVNADLTVVGQVYQANRPAFRVVGTGGQQTTTTNTTGVLNSTNWTQDFQQGTALNGSTGVFTAPYAGLYQVNLVVRTYSNALGTASQAVIEKNTSTVILMVEWAANTTMNHTGGSTVIKLAANDTLRFRVAQGSISFDANDNWSVAFLG